MTTDKAQKLVGLGGLALIVLGSLSMILPVFFFSPLDRSSWWSSLGVGLLLGLIPLLAVLLLARSGFLDLAQVVVGGGLILVGTMTLVSGTSLMLNGLLDGAEPTRHQARVERFWLDCSKHKSQNSTTTITTCRNYGSFSFPGEERKTIAKVELPDEVSLEPEKIVPISIRRGAFGWHWGLRVGAQLN